MKRSYWLLLLGLICLLGGLVGCGEDDAEDLFEDVGGVVEDTFEDVGETFDGVVEDVESVFEEDDDDITAVFTTTFQIEPITVTVAVREGSIAQAINAVKDEWEAQTGHTLLLVELPYNYLQQKIKLILFILVH